uniref:Uncharacterized protein n=1 Tax=Anguilla anguilla TaxID=7936 RepID=A0A0E9WN07_ANGAN
MTMKNVETVSALVCLIQILCTILCCCMVLFLFRVSGISPFFQSHLIRHIVNGFFCMINTVLVMNLFKNLTFCCRQRL